VPRNFTSKTPTNKRKVINSVSKARKWKGGSGKRRGKKGRSGKRGGLKSEGRALNKYTLLLHHLLSQLI